MQLLAESFFKKFHEMIMAMENMQRHVVLNKDSEKDSDLKVPDQRNRPTAGELIELILELFEVQACIALQY